jgi:hypothetical protein
MERGINSFADLKVQFLVLQTLDSEYETHFLELQIFVGLFLTESGRH